MKKLLVLAFVGIISLGLLALPALAAEFRGEEKVVIGPEEVIEDDLYLAGGTVIVEGKVLGDLVAFGSEITLKGEVEGDFIAAGRAITITGSVKDDARVAGAAIYLKEGANIADDCFAAGYSMESEPGSLVEGGLYVGAYQTTLAGEVRGDFRGGMGSLEIAGRIGGDVEVDVGEPDPTFQSIPFVEQFLPVPMKPPGFTLKDGAKIGGKLTYTSGAEGKIGEKASVEKGIAYQTPVPSPEEAERKAAEVRAKTPLGLLLDRVKWLVSLLVVGALLIWLVPNVVRHPTQTLQNRPWGSLGWGVLTIIFFILALIVVVVAIFVLDFILGLLGLGSLVTLVTGLGLLAEVALVVLFLVAIFFLTEIIAGFFVGRLVLGAVQPGWAERPFWPLLVGLVILVILTTIPYLGGLITLAYVIFGLGALWLAWRAIYARKEAQA